MHRAFFGGRTAIRSTLIYMAKHLRIYLQNLIPTGISEFLVEMKNLRKTLPKGKERMKMLDKKAQDYINSWSNK